MSTSAEFPAVEAAEQAAAIMAAAGMPRMASRALMAITAAPAEGYTAAELAERLGVSAAAISGAVKYLETIGLIHRVSAAGSRRVRFVIVGGAWDSVVRGSLSIYERLATLTDDIATQLAGDEVAQARSREIADFFRFFAERMPALIDEWEQTRRE